MNKILVTGGAGFIGSHFIRHILAKHDNYMVINLDALTYAGNADNLKDIETKPNYRFVHGDITDCECVGSILKQGIDCIVNFAAETHVDRSIDSSGIFVRTNILGTHVLLQKALEHGVKRFVQISTDEVYGSLDSDGCFTEESPLLPNNPYSASKASADMLVRAYHRTYGLAVIITRCSNNFGPVQYPEKLIPLLISRALDGSFLPIYGDGLNIRDWIYVEDHCSAIDLVLHHGKTGEIYNISAGNEMTNLSIAESILEHLGKPRELVKFVKDRPGHDRRYALDASKLRRELGWTPQFSFAEGLERTIEWYRRNKPDK